MISDKNRFKIRPQSTNGLRKQPSPDLQKFSPGKRPPQSPDWKRVGGGFQDPFESVDSKGRRQSMNQTMTSFSRRSRPGTNNSSLMPNSPHLENQMTNMRQLFQPLKANACEFYFQKKKARMDALREYRR